MKKLQLLALPLLVLLGMGMVNVFADYLQTSTTSQIMTNCNGGTFPVVYYVGASATVADTFQSSSNLIWRFLQDSSVAVYNPYNLLNFSTSLSSAFPFLSN